MIAHVQSSELEPTTPFPSLSELSDAFRNGELRPSDITRAHLDRIARIDPLIGAYQTVYAEDAMQIAEAADRMIDAGNWLGPFHGIPFALKDICDVEGRITTGGSRAMANRVSTVTGTLAQRLFAAGGVMLGKTKTVECALGGWGTNQHMGTPRNPWDMDVHRIPGGSSSGTGAGVAAGLAICGVGTDTGGSIRLPAGFCGLVGLKLTEGRLPTDGILPLSQTLDTPGPLARSVEDAVLMFLAMDGAEGWAIARDRAARRGLFGHLDRGVSGLRLGVLDEAERAACATDVLADYDNAVELLTAMGAQAVPFSAQRSYAELTTSCGSLIATEGYANHRHLYDDPDLPMDSDVRARMLAGRGVLATDYLAMLQDRLAGRATYLGRMRGLDALLTPSMTMTAPALDAVDQSVAPTHFTRHVNYFGLCALSVPSGLSAAGLPTSLQVIARPHDEAMALRIGAAYEATRGPMPYPDIA